MLKQLYNIKQGSRDGKALEREEDEIVIGMSEESAKTIEIAERLKRTVSSVSSRVYNVLMKVKTLDNIVYIKTLDNIT